MAVGERRRRKQMILDASIRIELGATRETVFDSFLSAGHTESEAASLASAACRAAAWRIRRFGLLRFMIGAAAATLGVVGMIAIVLALKAGEFNTLFVSGLSVPVLVFGLVAMINGAWAMVTGRESGIRPPAIVRNKLSG